jgi:hypothetical protein
MDVTLLYVQVAAHRLENVFEPTSRRLTLSISGLVRVAEIARPQFLFVRRMCVKLSMESAWALFFFLNQIYYTAARSRSGPGRRPGLQI